MASQECCEAGVPCDMEYTKLGDHVQINGMDVYLSGTGTKAILIAYDIFGFAFPQLCQMADRLAAAGYLVAMPDIFKGKPWALADFPPPDPAAFMEWLGTTANTDNAVAQLGAVKAWLQEHKGVTDAATLGFCWGGLISLTCASNTGYKANAACHPALFDKEDSVAAAAVNPVCILPGKGDPMEKIRDAMAGRPAASRCLFQRFDHMQHGFMGARGDPASPEVSAAVLEGFSLLVKFFNGAMPL